MALARVTLQPGREKSLAQLHPWVFSGSIATVDGAPAGGDTVLLHASDGTPLARAGDELLDSAHNACRLIHGESDGLPGFVADRYQDVVVVQIFAAGAERWRDALIDALAEATGCAAIYERSNVDVRALEGLTPREGPVRGTMPPRVNIVEDGLSFIVDVAHGQKTGFYLDQRNNRKRVRALTSGRDV